jgi:hypothetical protein
LSIPSLLASRTASTAKAAELVGGLEITVEVGKGVVADDGALVVGDGFIAVGCSELETIGLEVMTGKVGVWVGELVDGGGVFADVGADIPEV